MTMSKNEDILQILSFFSTMLLLFTASAGTDDNVSYLVGNDYGGVRETKSGEKQAPVQTLLSNQVFNKHK